MIDRFPMVLHEYKADDLVVRAEVPVLEIEGVIALLSVEYGGERTVMTTEKDLSDKQIFNKFVDKAISKLNTLKRSNQPIERDWVDCLFEIT